MDQADWYTGPLRLMRLRGTDSRFLRRQPPCCRYHTKPRYFLASQELSGVSVSIHLRYSLRLARRTVEIFRSPSILQKTTTLYRQP
jgi:hypothetical protein